MEGGDMGRDMRVAIVRDHAGRASSGTDTLSGFQKYTYSSRGCVAVKMT